MKPATETWVEFAELDCQAAERMLQPPDPLYRVAGFHAQQYIEKYLKAALEEVERPIPRDHEIVPLIDLVEDLVPELRPLRESLDQASPFAASHRCPPATVAATEIEADAEQAAETMRAVRTIVRRWLGIPGETIDSDPA